jgi:hypothetical protein
MKTTRRHVGLTVVNGVLYHIIISNVPFSSNANSVNNLYKVCNIQYSNKKSLAEIPVIFEEQ